VFRWFWALLHQIVMGGVGIEHRVVFRWFGGILHSKGKLGPKFLSMSSSHEFVPLVLRSRQFFWRGAEFFLEGGDSLRRGLE